jgi:hypothetical protein
MLCLEARRVDVDDGFCGVAISGSVKSLASYAPGHIANFVHSAVRGGMATADACELMISLLDGAGPRFLDPNHPRYSSKLAAATDVRQAMEDDHGLLIGKSPKIAMKKWLRSRRRKYGLVDAEGKTNELAIEEISKVANWLLKGGAPKTPLQKPTS